MQGGCHCCKLSSKGQVKGQAAWRQRRRESRVLAHKVSANSAGVKRPPSEKHTQTSRNFNQALHQQLQSSVLFSNLDMMFFQKKKKNLCVFYQFSCED